MQNNNNAPGQNYNPQMQYNQPQANNAQGAVAGKNNNNSIFAILSAICLIIVVLFNIINRIYMTIEYYGDFYFSAIFIYWLILIAFIVLLLMKKANIGLIITAGVLFVYSLFSLFGYFEPYMLIEFAAYAMLFLIVLFGCIDTMRKTLKLTQMLWFVPAAILFVYYLYIWIYYGYFTYFRIETALWILSNLIAVAAFLFLGLWLKGVCANAFQPSHRQGYSPNPQAGYVPNQPAGYAQAPQQGYAPNPQTAYNPNQQAGYAPNGPQGYAQAPQQGYAPNPQTGYNPNQQAGYAPNAQPGHPTSPQPGNIPIAGANNAPSQQTSTAPTPQTDAEKILMYKDLLDSGAITQEEFDEKKKQILNL